MNSVYAKNILILHLLLSSITLAKGKSCLELLALSYRPGTPTTILPSLVDPDFPGEFIHRFQAPRPYQPPDYHIPRDNEGIELQRLANAIRGLCERTPHLFSRLGFAVHPLEGGQREVQLPSPGSLNRRAERARTDGLIENNGLRFYPDNSPSGATHVDIARRFINNEVPYALSGIEPGGEWLAFHDPSVHLIGYLLIPRETVSLIQARLRFWLDILQLGTHSDLAHENIRREVRFLDSLSGVIQTILRGTANYSGPEEISRMQEHFTPLQVPDSTPAERERLRLFETENSQVRQRQVFDNLNSFGAQLPELRIRNWIRPPARN